MTLDKKIDEWINGDATALVLREYLIPVEGKDSPFFPPTFAGESGSDSDYCIDTMKDGTQTCLIDSVGSQANRMEPIFTKEPYSELVPQITIKAGEETINLCDVGHRIADALLRYSSFTNDITVALKSLQNNDPIPLAKMAPTSFVFGIWDSRETQVKLPRIVSSTIRAYDIDKLTRSAQYFPPVNYRKEELLGKYEDPQDSKIRAEEGFNEIPATNTHGGIIAHGDIQRDVVINFAALRKITSNDDKNESLLQKYILSLSLIAATSASDWYLRQGCLLVKNPEKEEVKWNLVYPDGTCQNIEMNHEEIIKYAQSCAKEFGVGENRDEKFESKNAKKKIAEEKKNKKKSKEK